MSKSCLFGAIADDYTGGSDLAGMLSEQGVRTLQLFGTDHTAAVQQQAAAYDALVVCLKTRSVPAELACRESLEALGLLRAQGARQVQFKYCSTFDSTERGNIGPVIEALMRAVNVSFTIAVPALPVNRRTQYLGHLFVGSQLLSDSPMRHHPLNPMTDSNLVRFLQTQTALKVGLIDLFEVRGGAGVLAAKDADIALVDAIDDSDLERIANRCADLPLITGGSGLGMKLPAVWRSLGLLGEERGLPRASIAGTAGTLILAGSCSAATLEQLRILESTGCEVIRMNVAQPEAETGRLLEASSAGLRAGRPVCIRSSAAKEDRTCCAASGAIIEQAFGEIARQAVNSLGVRKLIVAGGETSGAVVKALGVTAAEVSTVIDPGVPSLRTLGDPRLLMALKSGNFGAADFFVKTMRRWEQGQ